MKRDRSTPRRVAAVVAALVAGTTAASAAAFLLLVDADELASRIAPRASAALNRGVELGGARLTLLPRPGLRLEDVRVQNLPGFDGPALAGADRIDLAVALAPLVVGRIDITRARVRGLRVHVGIDEGGTSNFGDLVPSRTGSNPSVAEADASTSLDGKWRVRIALAHVDVTDGSLSYFDVPRERSLLVLGGSGRLDFSARGRDGWRVDVDGVSDSLLVRRGGEVERIARLEGPSLTAALVGDPSAASVQIESGQVDHQAFSLALSGRLDDLDATHPVLDLRLENEHLAASGLVALLPERWRAELLPVAEGTLDVGLGFRGSLDAEGPLLRGTVRLADVGIRLRGEPLAEGLGGLLRVGADSVRTDSLAGGFAGGTIELSGAFARADGTGRARVRANPDLARLETLELGPAGYEVTGDASIDAEMTGRIVPLEVEALHGRLELTGVRAEHPRLDVPVYLPTAVVEIDGDRLTWPDTDVLLGEQRLAGAGALEADLSAWWRGESIAAVDMDLSGPSLDLDAVLPGESPSDGPSYARIALAHAGGRELGGRSPRLLADVRGFHRPRELPIRGRLGLALDTLRYHGLTLDSLAARVTFGDSILAVEDASFALWGGRMSGSVRIGVWDALDAPFSLELHGSGVRAVDALGVLTPAGSSIDGTLDLDIDVVGSLDQDLLPLAASLDGGARLTVADGSVAGTGMNLALADFLAADEWSDVAFTTWTTELTIDGPALRVDRSRLEGDFAEVSTAGVLDLGGAADLSMGLSIPAAQLHTLSLRRTGIAESVLASLRAADQPLVLGLRVSGFLDGPTLEPDALAVQEVVARR